LGVTDSFPENSNFGLVDVRHRPYLRVTSALTSVNKKAAEIHVDPSRAGIAEPLKDRLFSRYEAGMGGPRPAVRMRQGRLTVDNGDVRLVLTPGKSAGIDSIYWHGIPMGGYHPLIWQCRAADGWLAPDRITAFTIENAGGNGLELSFRAEYVPRDTAWAAMAVSFRVVVPPSGSWFLAEIKGITSRDKRPWELRGYYHYIPSWIGGDAGGDVPHRPKVPNYWLEHGGWFDSTAGIHFGALSMQSGQWSFNPYHDSLGGQHPDIFRQADLAMETGQTYPLPGGPIVIYMGRDDRNLPSWAAAAFQTWAWLKGSIKE
jgi:hypothetical protein